MTVAGALASKLSGQNSCYQGSEGSTQKCDLAADNGTITAHVDKIGPYQGMTLAIGFAPKTFADAPFNPIEKLLEVVPVTFLLGSCTWPAPPWLASLKGGTLSHRILSFALLLYYAAAGWTWKWYQHSPQPERIAVRADKIPVTRLEKELRPAALTIRFSGSVARLDQLGKEIREGVRIEPVISGRWSWTSDSRLAFQPGSDWPASNC